MASIDWQKMTTQTAAAMNRHNGKQERVENRHSNKDIDTTRSHLNLYLGADDYKDMIKALKERVKAVDKEYPPERVRKDRVTCVMLEAPCPLEIQEQGRADEFFTALHDTYKEYFGAENVLGSCVHYDEQHEYTDRHGKKERSKAHAHTLVAAYVKWNDKGTEREGINGKHFMTKPRLNSLNKKVCDMVRERFGCDYNTGKEARKERVETLKEETERTQALLDRAAAAPVKAKLPTKGIFENAEDHAKKVKEAVAREQLEILFAANKEEIAERRAEEERKWEEQKASEEKSWQEQKAAEEKQITARTADLERRERDFNGWIQYLTHKLNAAIRWIKAHFSPSEQKAAEEQYQYRLLLEQQKIAKERTYYEARRVHQAREDRR